MQTNLQVILFSGIADDARARMLDVDIDNDPPP